jgi:hypothetical protein
VNHYKKLFYFVIFVLLNSALFAMDALKEEAKTSILSVPPNSNEKRSEDRFDFLPQQFPRLIEQARKPFERCYEETKHYDKLEQLVQQTQKKPEDVLLDEAKDVMLRKTLHFFGAEHEQFVLEQVHPFIEGMKMNHPLHGYYGTFFERALKNHTLLENLLLASEYIYQTVKDEGGGTVLFLGRTPCLVQVAYEEVLKFEKDEDQTAEHLNFSGHPDALTKRESTFFKSAINIARDMVTPQKLAHYFKYMNEKGILRAKKLFIVDILGSGSSLNSFLRILNAYYQKHSIPIPELLFLHLTHDVTWSMDRSAYFTFTQEGPIASRGVLRLPEDKKRNFRAFTLRAYGIPLFDKLITEMLDQDMFQEFLVHGVQYPAQKWTLTFDKERDEGGRYHKSFYEYLRVNFGHHIEQHQNYKAKAN